MRTRAALTAAVLLTASLGRADTEVRRTGDKVDVRTASAPLTEVLDRLARQTGMKVAYDGPQPRARVRVDLAAVTPLQAVLSILEGQGLNYALRMDPTGTRIETLLLVAGGANGAPAAAGAAPRPEVSQRMFERERQEQPEPPEPDEAPAEAPARDENEGPKSPRDVMPPNIPTPTGPAAPLMLPTPQPPGGVPGMMAPGAPNGMPGFPPGVIPSPAPSPPQ